MVECIPMEICLITIGSNGPYGRRKRSDLNPLISIWCKGLKNNFLTFFSRECNHSCDSNVLCFCQHILKIQVLLSEVIFLMYFFLLFFFFFLVFVYVSSVII